MHDYYMLIIPFSHMFRKEGAGRKGREREEFCQHMQSFDIRAVLWFALSLLLQGFWVPKESFGCLMYNSASKR